MNKKFTRKIRLTDPIIPYVSHEDTTGSEVEGVSKSSLYSITNNFHMGQLKLFYSELEFFTLVSKYIDINKCLVVYVGSATGYRYGKLNIGTFYPKVKSLLYDPQKPEIKETENIIIKTDKEGFFDDSKIPEVLKIADGRPIIYINDMRLGEDDKYVRETMIHDDLQNQQKYGIMMGAEFMLLKFRMLFYTDDPNEVDFIDNNRYKSYKDKVIFKMDDEKHASINKWMLMLSGTIYSQLHAPIRSTETRLFVKKIKYYKDSKKYSKEDQDKYKMEYYDNINYEGLLNYFNLKIRSEPCTYGKSAKLSKYLPGQRDTYLSASEYYIVKQYLKSVSTPPTFKNILNTIVKIYTFLQNKYHDNLINAPFTFIKRFSKNENRENEFKVIKKYYETKIIDKFIKKTNKQLKKLQKTKLIDEEDKERYINSFNLKNELFFRMENMKLVKKN